MKGIAILKDAAHNLIDSFVFEFKDCNVRPTPDSYVFDIISYPFPKTALRCQFRLNPVCFDLSSTISGIPFVSTYNSDDFYRAKNQEAVN